MADLYFQFYGEQLIYDQTMSMYLYQQHYIIGNHIIDMVFK